MTSNNNRYSTTFNANPTNPHLWERVLEAKNFELQNNRRRFIIIIVFDFVLITLLWLFSTVSKKNNSYLINGVLGNQK